MIYFFLFVLLAAVKAASSNPSDLIGVLVGNKSDFRDGTSDSRAEVVKEDAQRFSKDNGFKYFETSAVRRYKHVLYILV